MLSSLTPDELIAATRNDPYARASLLAGRISHGPWASGGAYLWVVTRQDEKGVVGIGDPADAAGLLEAVASEYPDVASASLPRGWVEHLGSGTTVTVRGHWEWFSADSAPPATPKEAQAGWLDADDAEVNALLTAASPGTSTWPGDDRARRWAGIRASDGDLVVVLADTSRHPAVANISSVATAPAHRRRGYAAALTAWAMRQFFAEGAEMVTLGMYSDNDAARVMYERLGFVCRHRFTAVALASRRADVPECADV